MKRGLARTGLRFLCNAAIGLALLTAVPFVMVGRTTADWTSYDRTSIRERLTDVERFRPLVAPTDPAITPMEAGIALRALQAGKPTLEFPVREAPALARPWTDHPVTGAMFAIRTPGSTLPRIDWVVLSAKGFSPDELAYLRVLAEAPIWKEFDRVGSARSVDVIGGQYVLPFGDDAFALNMPIPRFSDTKQLAMAGVSRAAYYLAIGQPDRAEAALRSIVSFGFALIDNGTGAMDAEIGRVIVHIGRTGMEHFYMATGAIIPAGTDIDYRPSSFKYSAPRVKSPVDAAVLRQRLIADVDNAALPRALRLQRLQQLTFPSCGSMSEVLFGPGDDVRNAFDRAKTTLARFPSEQAYIDLVYQTLNGLPPDKTTRSALDNLVMGAATVSAAVLNNPRVASCARVAMMSRPR